MENRLNKVPQSWLAAGLLLVVIILVLAGIIVPTVSRVMEYQDSIEQLVFRIQRYKRVIASQDEVFEQVEETSDQIVAQGYFSNQETVALASAELQKFIKETVSTAGGELTSTQVLPQKQQGELTRIAVKIRLSGKMDMLRSVLYEIETAKPLLIVEKLDITPVRGKRNRKTRKVEPTGNMKVNLEVVSYMRNMTE